jgi:hypothetical protein
MSRTFFCRVTAAKRLSTNDIAKKYRISILNIEKYKTSASIQCLFGNQWPHCARVQQLLNIMQTSAQILIHRDSKAWSLQVWVSFALAAFLCGVGLAYLPGKDLDRAFMVMGYFFCLSAAFVLAKFVRDGENASRDGQAADSPMFRFVVWGSFFLAMTLTGWGLIRMEVNDTYKAFLGVSWLYLITCTFTLAKTLRDRHEADVNEAHLPGRLARGARTESDPSHPSLI